MPSSSIHPCSAGPPVPSKSAAPRASDVIQPFTLARSPLPLKSLTVGIVRLACSGTPDHRTDEPTEHNGPFSPVQSSSIPPGGE